MVFRYVRHDVVAREQVRAFRFAEGVSGELGFWRLAGFDFGVELVDC
jgi:hypothetical protein